jgi:hypothetical protein
VASRFRQAVITLITQLKHRVWRFDELIAVAFSCVVVLFVGIALALHMFLGLHVLSLILGPLLAAIVATLAAWSAATFSRRADERAYRANSIELARRWDQEPFLSAREQTRGKSSSYLVDYLGQPKLKLAMIHWANFYWEMAVAIDTRWADEEYLRERFRDTLQTFYPAFQSLLFRPEDRDRAALEALETITELHLKWNIQTPAANCEELETRLRSLFSQIGTIPQKL